MVVICRRRRVSDDGHGALDDRPPRLCPDRDRARQQRLRHRAVPAPRRLGFNDIHPWNYHKLPEVLGGGTGYEVRTEGEFDAALRKAWADRTGMSLIQAHIPLDDASNALERLAERLSKVGLLAASRTGSYALRNFASAAFACSASFWRMACCASASASLAGFTSSRSSSTVGGSFHDVRT